MSGLQGNPVIIGEVLFDCFPDGSAVLGGAPFNVAWHLQGLGLSPLMVTAVGDDEHGQQVLKAMQTWGMDTRAVQIDQQHPTGQVAVTLQDGMPSYEIVPEQAYDFVDAERATNDVQDHNHALLYHGSLLARTERSRGMLDTLLSKTVLPTFVDINLRAPWYDTASIETFLRRARWVKLNDEELAIVMHGKADDKNNLRQLAQQCREKYDLELLIVTLGERGALALTQDEVIEGAPVAAKAIVDTVGAGDSFSAVMIAGLSQHWPLAQTLQRALQFAAAVCEMRGATSRDHSMYQRFLELWQ
jgi:fructokinase